MAKSVRAVLREVAELRRRWRSDVPGEEIDSIDFMDGLDRCKIDEALEADPPASIRAAIRSAITDWLADDQAGGVEALAETIIGIPGSAGSWTALEDAAEAAVHMIDRLMRDDGPPKDADEMCAEVRAAIVAQIGEIENREDSIDG